MALQENLVRGVLTLGIVLNPVFQKLFAQIEKDTTDKIRTIVVDEINSEEIKKIEENAAISFVVYRDCSYCWEEVKKQHFRDGYITTLENKEIVVSPVKKLETISLNNYPIFGELFGKIAQNKKKLICIIDNEKVDRMGAHHSSNLFTFINEYEINEFWEKNKNHFLLKDGNTFELKKSNLREGIIAHETTHFVLGEILKDAHKKVDWSNLNIEDYEYTETPSARQINEFLADLTRICIDSTNLIWLIRPAIITAAFQSHKESFSGTIWEWPDQKEREVSPYFFESCFLASLLKKKIDQNGGRLSFSRLVDRYLSQKSNFDCQEIFNYLTLEDIKDIQQEMLKMGKEMVRMIKEEADKN